MWDEERIQAIRERAALWDADVAVGDVAYLLDIIDALKGASQQGETP